MVITIAAAFAGSPEPEAKIGSLAKTTGAAITKGQVVEYVAGSDAVRTAAAGSTNSRYAVAVKDAAAAATKVDAVTKGPVTVIADGVIGPHAAVMVSGATAGQVVEATIGTAAPNSIVGYYIGKPSANERNGVAFGPAADGDVIIVDVNGGAT